MRWSPFLVVVLSAVVVQRLHLERGELPVGSTLLVIAHPDDEAMFFGPTMMVMVDKILCLSTGGKDGLGDVRRKEMELAAKYWGVHLEVLDHPRLQDGDTWDPAVIAAVVKPMDNVITFDSRGASRHRNHRQTSRGVRRLNTTKYELTTFPLRLAGPFAVFFEQPDSIVLINRQPWRTWTALSYHASQFVWYRKLYIGLSSYTYVNLLVKVV